MKTTITRRKKHTGRKLLLLNENLKGETLFKAARLSSVRLVHFNDYLSSPSKYLQAFSEGDGIYFESLNVAVLNADKREELTHLKLKMTKKTVLATEPERFIYMIARRISPADEIAQLADSATASWGISATGVPDTLFSGRGVRVAILDTGIYKEHIDLKGRNIIAKKFVSPGSAGDADGHGTHCAGIACGYKDEAGLRYGVAYGSDIYSGKVLNDNGEGTDAGILAGIEWAIKSGCKVISMSLGAASEPGEPYSETYENVAKRAMNQGSLIVAAAGNESSRPELVAPVGHPANCPSILAVGAVDSDMKIAWFSCGGINTNGGQVDIIAPGVSVYSMINRQNEHDSWDGTSMATPFVAGMAALYFEQNPAASPLEVWTLLTQHARRLDLSSIDGGSGIVQAPLS